MKARIVDGYVYCPCQLKESKMKMINIGKLEKAIKWFRRSTNSTYGGESTYEVALAAMEELHCLRKGGPPVICKPIPVEAPKDPLPALNERQMLMLHVANVSRLDLIDVGKATNARTADQLVELGVFDSWLRITDLGREVLKS